MEEVKYIPGDLVKINPSINKLSSDNAIMKVVEVNDDNLIKVINFNGTDLCQRVNVKDIIPIPLTTKILAENQWWADGPMENQAICPFCECLSLSAYYKDGAFFYYVNYGKEDLSMTIRYVHQLQHLLFGLGLNSELKV